MRNLSVGLSAALSCLLFCTLSSADTPPGLPKGPSQKLFAQKEVEIGAKVLPKLSDAKDKADLESLAISAVEDGGLPLDRLPDDSVAKAVLQNQQLQKLVSGANSTAGIEAALQGADKSLFYDNRWGADGAVVAKTFASDIETVATEFQQCQPLGHSFEQVMSEPQTQIGACYSKVVFPGVPSGLCALCIPSYPCGCYWILADLVDYYFPTFKLDASEQPYQSLYYEESIVKGSFAPENDRVMKESGSDLALQNLSMVNSTANLTMKSLGIKLPASGAPSSLTEGINTDLSDVPASLKTTVPDSQRVYTRNIGEPLNIQTESMWWIPHLPSIHYFGSDLPPFLPLVSRSLGIGAISTLASPSLGQKLFQFLGARGPFSCVDANKRSGKTAIDLDTPVTQQFVNKDLCLKNVGERFPLSDTRRVSITDRTWRGYAKDLDLFQAIVPPVARHTYDEGKDRFLVLRNEKLKNESPGCKPLGEMTRENIDYNKANEKDIKSGGENTVEVFTGFRGCWGYKGWDEKFWTYVVKWNGGDAIRLR